MEATALCVLRNFSNAAATKTGCQLATKLGKTLLLLFLHYKEENLFLD
jgi:hypothetical protein